MNTKHILLTSALVVSALAFTSCEDFFDTSSKKDLNTETAYSNLESAEMALVGCYDGWQRTISDEGVGMYLLAEFASEQAFAGLGLSDAKNNNVIDQFNLGIAPSYNDIFNVDWQNYYKAIFRCNQLIVQEENIDWAGDIKAQGRVMGEAHAIRGILYFDLVRMFGDVPLLTLLPKRIFPALRQAMFISSFSKTLNMPSSIFLPMLIPWIITILTMVVSPNMRQRH